MCDQACLLENIKLLASNYSKKFTADELRDKIDLFYKFLSRFDNLDITRAVNNLIAEGTVKGFPEVSDLKRYLSLNQNQQDTPQEYCDKCERTGYYTQWQEHLNKWYDFAYRCPCNHTTMQNIPSLASEMIPVRAHNPFPTKDERHEEFNRRVKT